MRARAFQMLLGAGLYAFVCAPVAAQTPAPEIPAPLRAAAECMERVLQAMPGVTNIQIEVVADRGAPYPVLEYNYSDASGRRRFTELRLFAMVGAQEPFMFDRADIADDPVAARVLPVWKARCRAGYGFITSRPG